VAYGIPYNHRDNIENPVNWFLAVDVANLLMDLDIPVHTIDWGHPNTRDPDLKDYNRGKKNAWFREHQVKIFADEFEKVGFKIIHKMKALTQLAEINKKEWDKYVSDKIRTSETPIGRNKWKQRLGHIEIIHHKYYWETKEIEKPKPRHPMENDPRIPSIIRGQHFDSWKSIAKALGYPR
jgi:nicotinamide mononucleotide adenylyltransferase